ncbi:hypothetical protein [Micromonospora sp. NPDC049799]|uniref:hypothetical protein n=1 Tax=Micromonospora sp. NPDC049799 TaxID=3154741 RepID=UPI0033FCC189
MSTDAPVDWTELTPQLVGASRQDQAWHLTVARELVAPATGSRATSVAAPPVRC